MATSLAAFLAYVVAQALPFASAVPAAITAVIATQASFHQATKGAFVQVIGALVGAAVALGIVSVVGSGARGKCLAFCAVVWGREEGTTLSAKRSVPRPSGE